ncbi:hypothetical protein M426DRAFT_182844 [Hypoxylon sp. CI-4A]|nr:hypothetical protein M426DRAFT_182844 [Hypoxylon sp. CI-4A]
MASLSTQEVGRISRGFERFGVFVFSTFYLFPFSCRTIHELYGEAPDTSYRKLVGIYPREITVTWSLWLSFVRSVPSNIPLGAKSSLAHYTPIAKVHIRFFNYLPISQFRNFPLAENI